MRYSGLIGFVVLLALAPAGLQAQTPEDPDPQAQAPVEAVEPVEPMPPPEPPPPAALIEGNRAFETDDYESAIASYLELHPTELPVYAQNRLGLSYHLTGRTEEAESTYRVVSRREEEMAPAYNNLGAIYFARGKFKDAENRFKDALEHSPESRLIQQNLRAAKYARENGRQIREVMRQELAEDPLLIDRRDGDLVSVTLLMPPGTLEQVTLHEKRGDSFLARKMYEDAIIEYERAIDIDKYNASVINRLGIAYHQSQRLREAERQYKAAIRLNPYYLAALNNLGSVEYTRKRYRRAFRYYQEALEIRPESPTILQNIGSCLFAMERWEDGLMVYIRALQLDPNLFDHNAGFGTLMQTTQRNESMVNFYMAKVFAQTGDKDRTMSYLYRAVEEGFDDVDMLTSDPVFEILDGDERFVQLVASFGDD